MSLGSLLAILEGPWDLVDCETLDQAGHAVCAIRSECPSRSFMFGINRAIKGAFDSVSLSDLVRGSLSGFEMDPIVLDDRNDMAGAALAEDNR